MRQSRRRKRSKVARYQRVTDEVLNVYLVLFLDVYIAQIFAALRWRLRLFSYLDVCINNIGKLLMVDALLVLYIFDI